MIAGRDARKARALARQDRPRRARVGLDVEDVQAIRDTVHDIGRVDILATASASSASRR